MAGRFGLTLRPAPHAGRESSAPPCKPRSPVAGFPLFASAKLLAEGAASRKKNGRLRAARLPRGPSRQPPLADLLYVRSFPLISI